MEKYPSETRILIALKGEKALRLSELSERMGITKMAVLNHIKKLESEGLIERRLVKSSVGRPYYVFKTKDKSKEQIADSNAWVLDGLLEYLEKTGNGELAEGFLKERYRKIKEEYQNRLSKVRKDDRINELLKIREEENYFPELKSTGSGSYELLEYNCPIFKISNRFGIACSLETSLFSSVLDSTVTATHRQVNGSDVCRFLIKKND